MIYIDGIAFRIMARFGCTLRSEAFNMIETLEGVVVYVSEKSGSVAKICMVQENKPVVRFERGVKNVGA